MELEDFKLNFDNKPLPPLFVHLWMLDAEFGYENYANGFGLTRDDKSGLRSWSEDDDFLRQLMPFAQANGSGSFYALWDDGDNKQLHMMPIVIFGDEGGTHIVAENLMQLMHLLTYDTEISVDHEQAYFYKDAKYTIESDNAESYQNWIKENLHLDVIENTAATIENAQKKYKQHFDNWINKYFNY